MKKSLLFGLVAVIAVSVTLVSVFSIAKAEEPESNPGGQVKAANEQLYELLNSYIDNDGCYTKLTVLETKNIEALGGEYHGGADQPKRRTYYDENTDALLMGDYDGGFVGINSGYAKAESDMQHYKNNAEAIAIDNLFRERNVDYTVEGTTPKAYFDFLSEIADTVNGSSDGWKVDRCVFRYEAEVCLTGSESENNNTLLKMFQYFAAPMVKMNNSLKLKKIEVFESGYYPTGSKTTEKLLVIKLFNEDNTLISSAYVVKGLNMQSNIGPAQVVIGERAYDLVINANAALYETQDNEFMLTGPVAVEKDMKISFAINGNFESIEGYEGNGTTEFDGERLVAASGDIKVYLKTWKDTGNQTVYITVS